MDAPIVARGADNRDEARPRSLLVLLRYPVQHLAGIVAVERRLVEAGESTGRPQLGQEGRADLRGVLLGSIRRG
jgi:hypothetical protein